MKEAFMMFQKLRIDGKYTVVQNSTLSSVTPIALSAADDVDRCSSDDPPPRPLLLPSRRESRERALKRSLWAMATSRSSCRTTTPPTARNLRMRSRRVYSFSATTALRMKRHTAKNMVSESLHRVG